MGLLDQFGGLGNLDPEQTQGLLAAAAQMLQQSGPSLMPHGFGQIAGGGLNAYQGGVDAARRRKQEEAQAAQANLLRGLQIQEAQGGLADHERARQQAALVRQAGLDYQNGQQQPPQAAQAPLGSIPMQSLPGQPQPQQQAAAQPQDEYQQRMGFSQFLRSRGMIQEANSAAMEALKFRDEFATEPRTVMGPDGKPILVQMSKGGTVRPIQGGYGVAEKLNFQNAGGKTLGLNPFTGAQEASFNNTQSPESIASTATSVRGQNMTDARARDFNAVQVEANNIKRAEKQDTADMTKNSQVASFDTMLGTLDRLSKHPGLPGSVGLRGKIPAVPGTESANFEAELNTFQSQAFLPMVAQLKGMGALSDAEGKKLTAAVGALDRNMGEPAFRASLKRIQDDMVQARARVSGERQPAAPAGQPMKKSAIKGQVMDGYRFMGGDPADQNNWEKL